MSDDLTPEDLPTEISRGVIEIVPGLSLEVIQLDNGHRLISEDSMSAFLEWLDRQ
jgi:hypothetical protein